MKAKLRSFLRPALAAGTVTALAAFVVTGLPAMNSRAADHLDAPLVKTDGRVDINDVYVFHPQAGDSQDLSRTVLVMTVNPAAGAISGTSFRTVADAKYRIEIDTDGNARPDKAVVAVFGKVGTDGRQRVNISLHLGDSVTPLASGMTDEVIVNGSVKAFAGVRDDPFFFDLASFNDGATFCEPEDTDFFLGLDTSAIVVELPTGMIGSGAVGVWGRTTVRDNGGWMQFDRMGRPGINTVFIPTNPFEGGASMEDAFNATKPRGDQAAWRAEVVNTLTLLFSLNDATDPDTGDDAAAVQGLADVLLPDILTVDLSAPTGFLNGRGLADDVIDAELGLITEGAITTDCVDNDSDFLTEFPYMGVPNEDGGAG
jgi:hypothetical protein